MAAPAALSTGLHPYLRLKDGKAAIAFYKKAFGAAEVFHDEAPDGRLNHARLMINGVLVMMSDDMDATPAGPQKALLHLEVDDPQRWWTRAADAGAQVRMPMALQPWGAWYGLVEDPSGHIWAISAPAK